MAFFLIEFNSIHVLSLVFQVFYIVLRYRSLIHEHCVFSVNLFQLSPVLTSEVHSVRAGRHLATKLNVLVQQHFDLASTTITNIPMKVILCLLLCQLAVLLLNLFALFFFNLNDFFTLFFLSISFFFVSFFYQPTFNVCDQVSKSKVREECKEGSQNKMYCWISIFDVAIQVLFQFCLYYFIYMLSYLPQITLFVILLSFSSCVIRYS